MSDLVAAVDCGTNTTRLLISDGSQDIERESCITGLGRGLTKAGRLTPEALARVDTVLVDYRDLLAKHGVERCRAIATSAVRDAHNSSEFFSMAEEALGHRPELISGIEEGSLTFRGATEGLDLSAAPFLVVDIGGGSTEFAVGSDSLDHVLSVDIGSVRLTEQFMHSDPPRAEELANVLQIIESHLDDVRRDLPGLDQARTIIAVAGTATTVVAIEVGLQVYDRQVVDGFVLSKAAAEDVFRTIATESLADRVHNPGLEPARADVIVAGAAILVGIIRYLGADSVLVREHDLLDGLVATLLD